MQLVSVIMVKTLAAAWKMLQQICEKTVCTIWTGRQDSFEEELLEAFPPQILCNMVFVLSMKRKFKTQESKIIILCDIDIMWIVTTNMVIKLWSGDFIKEVSWNLPELTHSTPLRLQMLRSSKVTFNSIMLYVWGKTRDIRWSLVG